MALHIGNNVSIPKKDIIIMLDVLSAKDTPFLFNFLQKDNRYRSIIVSSGREGTVLYGTPIATRSLFGRAKQNETVHLKSGYHA